ncbi:DUF1330 domain-containing protein [Novosphingobium sp. TH158]|uniref:DUF1330 domain-containing protein n=1 Tax=Novosphingobium sp. TH158 TaxID=2067455 RepID=UPI000C7A7943|nr:DUF1330 domain-containing protein [Novosphingobium sp. TH158]PLK26242.1 DUF1330 domain-containing protein [Novosphingobium sp. TH158]
MTCYVNPDRENFAAFKALPRDRPIQLLNLIRYRESAAYPEGHACAALGWSGERAFAEYFTRLVPVIHALGGGMIWEGRFEGVITGPAQFEWDRVFVMGFPSANAFLAMVTDPHYKEEVVPHRTAAVLDSRLVRYGEG